MIQIDNFQMYFHWSLFQHGKQKTHTQHRNAHQIIR